MLHEQTLREQKLQEAAQSGDNRKVARLIKSGVSVNSTHHVSSDCTCRLY